MTPPADEPSELKPGAEFAADFVVVRKIGEGGMGAVFLAHDTVLDRPVALKIPFFGGNKATAAARFLREAQAAAGLQHPNVCPIFDVGQVGDTHFLCMQFLAGRPLSDRVGPNRPLAPPEAARIVRSIAGAMQAAHAKGVIHRDLKPVNVMMTEAGEPVVMDFGLARTGGGSGSGGPQLTVQGDIMGTPAYMPPEQVRGEVAQMGPASDIYSLGVVLYELLTGEPPFKGEMFALLSQIALDAPQPPSARRPGLDPRYDAVVLKALAKNPDERWKSMQALADALATLAGGGPPASADDAPPLILRVAGTPFAYKPPPGLPQVRVGRKKRVAGEPPESGNDFVLRVAGNDALSARISRRHLDLVRVPGGWTAVDLSKTGVTVNGRPLPAGTPVPLADGDVLVVAGVVTLEVGLGGGDGTSRPAAMVEVPAPAGSGGGQLQLEASLGDLVTMAG